MGEDIEPIDANRRKWGIQARYGASADMIVRLFLASVLWFGFGATAQALANFGMPADPPASAQTLTFDVMRDGSSIGTHRVTIREAGNRREVDVAIDMAVKLAFVTVYRYTHRATEIWSGDRLVSLEAWTDDNGTRTRVMASAGESGLEVSGSGGSYMAPADTAPSSYWNRDKLTRTALLDTQSGKLAAVANENIGKTSMTADGRTQRVSTYRVTGDLKADLSYAEDDSWIGLRFEARGAQIVYVRRSFDQVAQLR
jgi:hypothetical protein